MKNVLACVSVALVATFGVAGCGDSGGTPDPGFETGTGDDSSTTGDAVDGEDTAGDAGGGPTDDAAGGDEDVPPTGTDDTEGGSVDDAGDTGGGGGTDDDADGGGGGGGTDDDADAGDDGPTCVEDKDCKEVLGDQLVQCTRPGCVAGECVVLPIVNCCQNVEECDGVLNLDACEQAACVDQQCIKTGIPNCCSADADCAELADGCCSEAFCTIENTCAVDVKDSCCAESIDCDDGVALTNDVCVTACESDGCQNSAAGECEEQSQPISKNFDDGSLQLLATVDTNTSDSVGVQTSKQRRVSGKYSVYFGDPSCETYFNGAIGEGCELPAFSTPANTTNVNLELRVPQFALGDSQSFYLGFWVNMAAEPAITVPFPDGDQILDVDWLQVIVDDGDGSDVVWRSTDPEALGEDNTTGGDWLFQVANLGSYSGKAITVTFNFVTDNASNFNENPAGEPWYGVYLDDVVVSSVCEALTCDGDGDSCGDDIDACTVDACTGFAIGGGGICGYETSTPGSACKGCGVAADCGSDVECFDYSCDAGICDTAQKPECCAPSSTFPDVTAPGEVALEGFEDDDIGDWNIVDDIDDNVSWQVTTILTYNGTHSLYFGDPTKQTYAAEPPNPARATAWTPLFEVPADDFTKGIASFWLWMSTEFDGAVEAPDPELGFDQLKIWVKGASPTATPTQVWDSATTVGNSTDGEWRQIGVDLSAWAGTDIRLGFDFDSGDAMGSGTANNFGGVRIDDLTVTSICSSECLSYTECEDDDFCTAEHCDLGECVSLQEDESCCFVDADCDDDNACSVDECGDEGCTHYYDDSSDTKLNCCPANGAPWLGAWQSTFEEGTLGAWQTEDETLPVIWHVNGESGAGGSSSSANFSDPETGTFANGDSAASGLLISPPVDVPPLTKGTPYAEFDLLLSTEWDGGDPNEFFPGFVVDDLTVAVAIDGYLLGAVQHWESHFLFNTTKGEWLNTRLDLSDYLGQTVQLVFEFDSGDKNNNDYGGAFIDNVGFSTTCLTDNAVQCLYGGDCTPSDDCKVVACSEDFKCIQSPKPTPECCEPFVVPEMTWSFEEEPDGWEYTECNSGGAPDDASAVWQFVEDGATCLDTKVGNGSLYFGNGTQLAADEFGGCDQITSSCVALEGGVPWSVGMWLYVGAEKDTACNGGGAPFSDQLFISVQDCAGEDTPVPVLAKFDLQCNEYDKWIFVEFDLDDFAGQSVKMSFSMDTWDAFVNTGCGIGVDEIEFTKGCAGTP